MKLLLENFRKYSEEQTIIEEVKKMLKEQGINPCQNIDFNKLIIQAVENPKNIETFKKLRKAIFGAHKKSKKESRQGTIEIVNNSGHDLYDFRVISQGPHIEDWNNAQNIDMEAYDEPKPVDEAPYRLIQGGGDKTGGVHIPKGENMRFHSPTGTVFIRYLWFPERFFTAPYTTKEEEEPALMQLANNYPGKWNGQNGTEGKIEVVNLPAMAIQPIFAPDGKKAPPLKKGVTYKIIINPGKLWPEGATNQDQPIRVPAKPFLEVEAAL